MAALLLLWKPQISSTVMLLNIMNYLSVLFLFQSRILFWIWAALPQPELNNYRYEIHFDIPPNMKPLRQHYSGTVKSLEISASELTQHNTHHYRSIVYFTQTHIRRALSFTHNLQQPPPKTLDMKYTVKIMRQS